MYDRTLILRFVGYVMYRDSSKKRVTVYYAVQTTVFIVRKALTSLISIIYIIHRLVLRICKKDACDRTSHVRFILHLCDSVRTVLLSCTIKNCVYCPRGIYKFY